MFFLCSFDTVNFGLSLIITVLSRDQNKAFSLDPENLSVNLYYSYSAKGSQAENKQCVNWFNKVHCTLSFDPGKQ